VSLLEAEHKTYDFISMFCRERFGLSERWQWCELESGFPSSPKVPGGTVWVRGGEPTRTFTKGKRRGQPDWKDVPLRTLFYTCEEFKAWQKSWEDKTGDCSQCHGTGNRWMGWNRNTGDKLEPCDKCGATGKVGGAG
jgi:hypothetical protein